MNTLPTHRNQLIDALRGYALMGLFLVHMVEYFELYWYNPVDSKITSTVFAIFGGKSYAIFAFLFGVSFDMLLNKKHDFKTSFNMQMVLRFTALFILGLFHGVLYGGDILQLLAVVGFVLLIIYRLPASVVLVISVLLLLQIPSIIYLYSYISGNANNYNQPLHWSLFGEVHKVYAEGNFMDLLKINIFSAPQARLAFFLESGRLSTIFGISMLGFWLNKMQFFKDYQFNFKKYLAFFISCILMTIIIILFKQKFEILFQTSKYWMCNALLNNYFDLVYTFLSISTFVVLYKLALFQYITKPLVACGKMSLTFYISQSIVMVPIFYGFGLGAFRTWGPFNSLMLGIVLWILQVLLANYWLKKYNFGPFEWLWRVATFKSFSIKFKK